MDNRTAGAGRGYYSALAPLRVLKTEAWYTRLTFLSRSIVFAGEHTVF